MVRIATDHWVSADDGARLAVFAHGGGDGPALVCANGIACSTGFWRYIVRYYQGRHRVVTWDYRGHGRSPRPADLSTLTIAQFAHDLRAVLDAASIERAVLLGHSMGSQVILEFYRKYPERVAGLIPILGTYGRPLHTFLGVPWFGKALDALHPILRLYAGRLSALNSWVMRGPWAFQFARWSGIVNPHLCKAKDMEDYFRHLAAMDMRVFVTLLKDMAAHTAEPVLERIDVPTLVIGGEHDRFTPIWLSYEMHARIPASELLIVPGGSHAALVEQPELINLRIEKFLRERVAAAAAGQSPRSLARPA